MQAEHHIAIETKYHGATNTKGSRYSASYNGKRVTVSTDHSLDSHDNHEQAALKFIDRHFARLNYKIRAYGCTKSGYVFLVR